MMFAAGIKVGLEEPAATIKAEAGVSRSPTAKGSGPANVSSLTVWLAIRERVGRLLAACKGNNPPTEAQTSDRIRADFVFRMKQGSTCCFAISEPSGLTAYRFRRSKASDARHPLSFCGCVLAIVPPQR